MPDQTDREEAIFHAAVELTTPEEQSAYVVKACGDDQRLRKKVMRLLRAHEHAGTFLDPVSGFDLAAAAAGVNTSPPRTKPNSPDPSEKPGDRIEHYKLLQKIGEGGCGVVYMAEQEEPVRRRVALKIIKAGMDTRQVIARFEAERQALAMMDHPNIARVLDAGATETGRPYFVMDLVRGIRITEYCDRSKLDTRERLTLFTQVCHAIQHAHQKGIIHRDIKPSNILVTLQDGVPVPVIIDFGIAKATEQRLTDKTLFTAFEQFIGTPAYMSPEQAEMSRLDIDTRSDIYALGVLLYELLTGKTPFDAKALLQSGLDAMRRTIREKEPVRPSTRLSTMLQADLTILAEQHRAEPLKLIHLLRGDLDWIVMKCLEKDRTRRYETANALALDVERYLHNEPVLARPPSKLYRFQKLVRRNKVAFAAGAAIAGALIVGLAVSMHLLLREREAYDRAVLAEQSEGRLRREAEKAHANEATQRVLAEANARTSRLNSYAADVYSAFLAVQSGNLGRALDLLEHQIPPAGEEDLRGFAWRYVWQQAQGDEMFSLPHDGLVSCAIFARDGQQLFTASYDGKVRVWDLGSRRVVKTLAGFEEQFGWRYIACSSDDRWLAGSRSGKLTVWACNQRDYPVEFEESSGGRAVLAFTPDNARLVGWGPAGLVVVDTETWQSRTLPTRLKPGSFPAVAIDPSGKLVALASEQRYAIEIWNLETLRQERFLKVPGEGMAFVALAWSPDNLLAASTWAGGLRLIDPETGHQLAATPAHVGSVFGLTFTRDGTSLITAGHDQLIHFWTVPQLEKVGTLHGHRDEIWALDISRDGRFLATAGKDGTAKLWITTPRPPPFYVPNPKPVGFTSDSRYLVTMTNLVSGNILEFWDLENAGVRTTKSLAPPEPTNLLHVIVSSDARLLGAQKSDGTVEVWNFETGKLMASRAFTNGPVRAASFSRSRHILVLGTAEGSVTVWNLNTGQTTRFGGSDNGSIQSVGISPRERFIQVTAAKRKHDFIWDTKTGSEVAVPVQPSEHLIISADDKTVAVFGRDYVVRLWDLPSTHERAVLQGHRWTINTVAFSSDGRMIATGSGDAVARIWDVATGKELTRALRGHLQGVTELVFSPDGQVLATGSTDDSVRLWHVPTGRELFSMPEASDPAFSPDGNSLALRTDQGLRLIHVPSLAQIDTARLQARAAGL